MRILIYKFNYVINPYRTKNQEIRIINKVLVNMLPVIFILL